jgi:hypothetical protein
MIQQIIVILTFLAAVAYLGRIVYRSFAIKSGCSTGCGKCGVDFQQVEKTLKEKGV